MSWQGKRKARQRRRQRAKMLKGVKAKRSATSAIEGKDTISHVARNIKRAKTRIEKTTYPNSKPGREAGLEGKTRARRILLQGEDNVYFRRSWRLTTCPGFGQGKCLWFCKVLNFFQGRSFCIHSLHHSWNSWWMCFIAVWKKQSIQRQNLTSNAPALLQCVMQQL